MPFPLSYTISAETAGPGSDPTATGGLAAALATALRAEELDFSQPDPCTFRVRKRFGADWTRWNTDPWTYPNGGTLRIEQTASGLRVRLTVNFITMPLIATVFAGAAVGFGFPVLAAVALVSCGVMYLIGRSGMEEWLDNATRRSDGESETA